MVSILLALLLASCESGYYYEQFDNGAVVEGCTYLDLWVQWNCSNPDCHDAWDYESCYADWYSLVERCEENGTYCVDAERALDCEQWMDETPSVESCDDLPGECAQGRVQETCTD